MESVVNLPGGGLPTEPPDDREPPSLADWLKRNNMPKCMDCGGRTEPTGRQAGNRAQFRCVRWNHCRPTIVSIRPLSLAEREED